MKVVQAGILIALIAIGALLFMVWRGQQPAAPMPAVQPTQPAAAATAPPPEAPPAAPPKPSAEKPSPAPRWKSATKPAAAETKPEPAAAPQETPVSAAPQTAESAPAASVAPPVPPAPETPAVPAETPPPPRTVTISVGTLLSARLAETLSSDKVRPGDTFTATLDRPLAVDGLVIAERGARVEGRVVEAQQAGRLKGVSSLAIQLVRLRTSDGQRVDIQTDAFHKAGETTRGEDAAKVAVGAGLGAAIGAIAGGGKGAAIGAGVGGAAGAGTVAATRGKPVVLPVETRIDFRLSSAVTLTEKK
jgi:hypothetical protein